MPRDKPTDLAALERALDSKQYFFLNPSTSSATSSGLTSARCEFILTPSAARVSSTRNNVGGILKGEYQPICYTPASFTSSACVSVGWEILPDFAWRKKRRGKNIVASSVTLEKNFRPRSTITTQMVVRRMAGRPRRPIQQWLGPIYRQTIPFSSERRNFHRRKPSAY